MEYEIKDSAKKIRENRALIKEIKKNSRVLRGNLDLSEETLEKSEKEYQEFYQQYKAYKRERTELKHLNSQWEKSVKALENQKEYLESQISAAEANTIFFQEKILSKKTRNSQKKLKKPRFALEITQLESLKFEKKPNFKKKFKVFIVADEETYQNPTAIQLKTKSRSTQLEFDNVIQKKSFSTEVSLAISNIKFGGNACIINYSIENREKVFLEIIESIISNFPQVQAHLNFIEIIGDYSKSLIPDKIKSNPLEISTNLLEIYLNSKKNISKAKNHTLLSLQINSSVLQILDVAILNMQKTLTEGLSINSSLYYLEELLVNMSHKGNPSFTKAELTRNLALSMENNSYSIVLVHCEDFSNTDMLAFVARIQKTTKKKHQSKEVMKTVELLERERKSNNKLIRTIEKIKKDVEVYSNVMRERETMIYHLNEKIRNKGNNAKPKKITSLSPSLLRPTSNSRIPTPKVLNLKSEITITVSQLE